MQDKSMSLQEFQEQVSRLHRRFSRAYRYRQQVELAFLVSGLSLEWFKIRVDYVIRSGDGKYDWAGAAASAKKWKVEPMPDLHAEVVLQKLPESIVVLDGQGDRGKSEFIMNLKSPPLLSAHKPYGEWLEEQGVSSAVELLEKKNEGPNE